MSALNALADMGTAAHLVDSYEFSVYGRFYLFLYAYVLLGKSSAASNIIRCYILYTVKLGKFQ